MEHTDNLPPTGPAWAEAMRAEHGEHYDDHLGCCDYDNVKRVATDEDRERLAKLRDERDAAFVSNRIIAEAERARVLALGKELDIPVPGTTTVSLDLAELSALRSGMIRYSESDDALYRKLCRAETRLTERLTESA